MVESDDLPLGGWGILKVGVPVKAVSLISYARVTI